MLSKTRANMDIEFQLDISGKGKEVLHYPTLKTVLMVERVIQSAKEPVNKSEIKRRLDVKIMHQTLNLILSYLEKRGIIIRAKDGYVWIYNPSKKLAKAIQEGTEV